MNELTERLSERLDHLADTSRAYRNIDAVMDGRRSHLASVPEPSPHRRLTLRVAAATILIIGIGAIAITRNDRAASPAANQPPPPATAPTRVPRSSNPVDFPVFGDLGALDVIDAGQMIGQPGTPRPLSAVLGRRVDDRYIDIVRIEVNTGSTSPWPDDAATTPVVIAGTEVSRVEVTQQGSRPAAVGYVWESNGATISITDSPATGQLVAALTASVDTDGLPAIDTANLADHLPDGYELLDGPTVDLTDIGPSLDATSNSVPDEQLTLHVWPTLMLTGTTWQTVQVGDERGYLIDSDANNDGQETASLAWPTPNGSWATLYGYGTVAEQLPEIAATITWVDADTWTTTYNSIDAPQTG